MSQLFSGKDKYDNLYLLQIINIQCIMLIKGGREISRPYRVWFFAEDERFLSFWRCHRPRWGGRRWWCGVADSSFSLKPQTKGTVLLVCLWHIQTKRTVPLVCFGLWFMWFAWNQTCHSTNDRCEALASLKGCFLCFCFSPPVSPSSILWGGEIYKCKCWARRNNRRFSALSAVVNNFFCNLQNLSGLNL